MTTTTRGAGSMPASVKASTKARRWLSVSTCCRTCSTPPRRCGRGRPGRRGPGRGRCASRVTSGTPWAAQIDLGCQRRPAHAGSTTRSTPSARSSSRSASSWLDQGARGGRQRGPGRAAGRLRRAPRGPRRRRRRARSGGDPSVDEGRARASTAACAAVAARRPGAAGTPLTRAAHGCVTRGRLGRARSTPSRAARPSWSRTSRRPRARGPRRRRRSRCRAARPRRGRVGGVGVGVADGVTGDLAVVRDRLERGPRHRVDGARATRSTTYFVSG